jgi:hypothetical protein
LPRFCRFRSRNRRIVAGECGEIRFDAAGDSPRALKDLTMTRSPGAAGFSGRSAPAASSRLTDAVAAALAIGSLSLCLIVAVTVLSIKVGMALPVPA